MATHRFYISPQEWNPEAPSLTGAEAHHCRDVMRAEVGSRLVVFDGCGKEVEAEITSISRDRIETTALIHLDTEPPPARLTLGQAIPKGKNMDLIIQKATELGVAKIVPILSERTVVQLKPNERQKKQDKWQRVAIEACKQCGQNWLPEVAAPMTVSEFLSHCKKDPFRIVAAIDSQSQPLKQILRDWRKENNAEEREPRSATVMIGPEGDFTPAEVAEARAESWAPLSLGPIILRSETAAIYALSILGHELMG